MEGAARLFAGLAEFTASYGLEQRWNAVCYCPAINGEEDVQEAVQHEITVTPGWRVAFPPPPRSQPRRCGLSGLHLHTKGGHGRAACKRGSKLSVRWHVKSWGGCLRCGGLVRQCQNEGRGGIDRQGGCRQTGQGEAGWKDIQGQKYPRRKTDQNKRGGAWGAIGGSWSAAGQNKWPWVWRASLAYHLFGSAAERA